MSIHERVEEITGFLRGIPQLYSIQITDFHILTNLVGYFSLEVLFLHLHGSQVTM